MKFVTFMSSSAGRGLRIVAGIALLVLGLVIGGGWMVLSVVGLIPFIAGLINVCLLAPLFGQPLKSR